MKDQEFEAIAAQEDPIVMYLIVRESLGMSTGKTAAQCAHASQMLVCHYFRMKEVSSKIQKALAVPKMEPTDRSEGSSLYAAMAPKISIMGEWLNSAVRKVVLRASDKDWAKLKEEFKDDDSRALVIDAGLTEIPSGSETVIGLWPVRKSQVSKTVKRLQVLK